MEKPVSEPEAPQSESVDAKDLPEIRYEKSSQLRVIHCDGAVGTFTPKGFLGVSLYSERVKLPEQSVLGVDGQGVVTESVVVTKPEITREIEATVLLSESAAESLGAWLLERVQKFKGKAK